NELQGDKGFIWQSWDQAAQWSLQHNVNLEEALKWTDTATNNTFPGIRNFQTLSTRAQILNKLGRTAEADAIMKEAMPMGTMIQVHQYGRQLLQQKKTKEALEILKANAAKYPNTFTTLMGLTRAYSANGDYKNALKTARQALSLAPNAQNKTFVETGIKKLEEGKDINL
ncbi:MAG: tetratricopeptide repeat protein, partial [Ferruginibacter sp.]